MVLLSGSIGYTLLYNDQFNKHLLIFSDIHNNKSYCKKKSICIDNYLFNKSKKNLILLEEVSNEERKHLKEIWTQTIHTQRLKQLALKVDNDDIIKFDIRNKLLPFSLEILSYKTDKKFKNIKLINYLKKLDIFFLSSSQLDFESIIIKNNFFLMKKYYEDIKSYNKSLMHRDIHYVFFNFPNFYVMLSNLLGNIIEFNCIILLFKSNKNCIIHTGLIHAVNLVHKLEEVYGFKIIEEVGISKFPFDGDDDDDDGGVESCLELSNVVTNIF
jgi:hypothetical protein